jgi:RNA polymerase sigma-70 factor (ECF subfamily)
MSLCELLVSASFFILSASDLDSTIPFYKATEHFRVHCVESDQSVVDTMVDQAEVDYQQLARDFHHEYMAPITFAVYSDIATFHEAMGWPDAPAWFVGFDTARERSMVSPNNPGPEHTHDGLMAIARLGLVECFIQDAYKNVPRWLCQGIAFYKQQWCSKKRLSALAADPSQLPTIEQLEPVNQGENFVRIHGFDCSYALVEFLYEKWGWEKILALLEHYENFDAILGMSKKEIHQAWVKFLVNRYALAPSK